MLLSGQRMNVRILLPVAVFPIYKKNIWETQIHQG